MKTPTPTIYLPYHALDDVIARGSRAAQPDAADVPPGALYGVTDEGDRLERSNGATWDAYAPAGGGGVSLGFAFDFSSQTEAPPTSSQLRFDAAHPYDAVTRVWCRLVTTDGVDVAAYLRLIPAGSSVYVQDKNDHTLFVRFTTTAATVDLQTYIELPVAHVAHGGALLNNQAVEVLVVTGGSGGEGGELEAHAETHEPGGSDPLVALDAGVLQSGTLPDARLSGNVQMKPIQPAALPATVAYTDAANVFTHAQTIGPVAAPDTARLVLVEADQPADTKRWQVVASGQHLYLMALDDADNPLQGGAVLSRTGDLSLTGELNAAGLGTSIPKWADVPFLPGNFLGTGGASLTVALGHVTVNRYTLMGKTLIWNLQIDNATIAGSGGLDFVIPGNFGLQGGLTNVVLAHDGSGVWQFARMTSNGYGAGTIGLGKLDFSPWTAGAFYLYATVTLEIL